MHRCLVPRCAMRHPPTRASASVTRSSCSPDCRGTTTAAAALSLGQDPRWRRAMVETAQARPGERVLDVATGTGLVAQQLVRRYGCSVGLDQSPAMLDAARARLARDPALGQRSSPVTGEAERLPFADAEFDHGTFTYLLRYVDDPRLRCANSRASCAPGGAWSRWSSRAAVPAMARAVQLVHTRRAAHARPARLQRMAPDRQIPREQHPPSSMRAIRSSRWSASGPTRRSARSTRAG